MKTLIHRRCFLTCGLLLSLVSCSEDVDLQELRDEAVGTYEYTAKYYKIETGSNALISWGTHSDRHGTFSLDETDQGLEATEDGQMRFRGSKVAAMRNGFTFEIDPQMVVWGGSVVQIEGYMGVAVGDVKYHGRFLKPHTLEAWIQRDVVLADPYGNIVESTWVVAYTATKM